MASTTARQETPLRKRKSVLERAQSLSNLNALASPDAKTIPLPSIKHKEREPEGSPASPTDYESRSESSEDDYSEVEAEVGNKAQKLPPRPTRPTVQTQNIPPSREGKRGSPMSPNSRAWYEFDLAVVVALVSPIGNWLTGGDHIKNLLLIAFLIFYLHQIIEVPWALYQKSRPRSRPTHLSSLHPESSEARYARLAASELQKLEYLFLFLTFASPFLGAILLRYASGAVLGPNSVSWFSTGLFVLATGMRPWAHLVERLSDRAGELHDFIHYPTAALASNDERHEDLEKRVAHLEKSLNKIASKVTRGTEGVYDYVDDAVNAVEHAIKKQERRWGKYESKMKEIEESYAALKSSHSIKENRLRAFITSNLYQLIDFIRSLACLVLPRSILSAAPKRDLYNGLYANSTAASSIGLSTIMASRLHKRPASGQSSPLLSASPLETIFEEDPAAKIWRAQYPWYAQPSWFTSNIVYRAGYVITMPLRAVVRMVLRNY